jgi:hypothetical protein
VIFDLDDLDGIELEDGEIETIDGAWLEPVDDTVIEADPEGTSVRVTGSPGYPAGLDADELDAVIGRLTRELCGTGSGRHRFGRHL